MVEYLFSCLALQFMVATKKVKNITKDKFGQRPITAKKHDIHFVIFFYCVHSIFPFA